MSKTYGLENMFLNGEILFQIIYKLLYHIFQHMNKTDKHLD